MKMASVLLVSLMLVLGALMGIECYASPGLVGQKAPEIKVDAWLNSVPLTLKDLKGRIVVLEFWATWCPPCRKSIPHLIKLHKRYKDKGVVMVSITNESRKKVESFVRQNRMEYPIGTGGTTSRTYGVKGIPHAFIINDEGMIVWEGHPMAGLDKAVEKEVKKLEPKRKKAQQAKELWAKGRDSVKKGDHQAAIKYFQQASQMDPSYSSPYYGLGFCYAKIGDKERALEYYNKYLEITEGNPKKEKTRAKVRQRINKLKSSEQE